MVYINLKPIEEEETEYITFQLLKSKIKRETYEEIMNKIGIDLLNEGDSSQNKKIKQEVK